MVLHLPPTVSLDSMTPSSDFIDLLSSLFPTPSSSIRVPLGTLYLSFSQCTGFPDVLAIAASYTSSFDPDTASLLAQLDINNGLGIDLSLMSFHMDTITTYGLESFFRDLSDARRVDTFHIRPTSMDFSGPPRYQIPVPTFAVDHTSHSYIPRDLVLFARDQLYQHISQAGSSLSATSNAMPSLLSSLVTTVPTSTSVVDMSTFQTGDFQSLSFAPLMTHPLLQLSNFDKLQYLAEHGMPYILPPGFTVNTTPTFYPASIAPPLPIERVFAEQQRNGQGCILPLTFLQSAVSQAQPGVSPVHLSTVFMTAKRDDPNGRHVCNFTHGFPSSINHCTKKDVLASVYTPIRNPQLCDTCQLLLNACAIFSTVTVLAFRFDIKSAFHKTRIAPSQLPLGTLPFQSSHSSDPWAFVPFTCRFGNQDSNYAWQLAAMDIQERSTRRCLSLYGKPLTAVQTDDTFGFLPLDHLLVEEAALVSDATALFGPDPFSSKKRIIGSIVEINGFLVNCTSQTVSLSESIFTKLVRHLYISVPWLLPVGTKISVTLLQTLQSYVILCSQVMVSLKSFTKGFSHNLIGIPSHASGNISLTSHSICDIWVWRTAVFLAAVDTRWITVHASIPILYHRHREESLPLFALRQASTAHYVCYGDACTTFNGLGCHIPFIGWSQFRLDQLSQYYRHDLSVASIDINILEFIAAISSAILIVCHLRARAISTHNIHIHIWSDNSTCLSWIRSHRADHPLHLYLLHVFSFLQVYTGIHITTGHLSGVYNIYADAASRFFQCQNGLDG